MASEDGRARSPPQAHDSIKRDGESVDDSATRPPPRKRRRIVISCTECHRRKQKCDRKLPCTNCVARNKQNACQYDKGAPTLTDKRAPGALSSNDDPTSPDQGPGAAVDSIPTKVANFGYSQTGASTLGFLRKIEGANPGESLSKMANEAYPQADHLNMRERYKSLIRQLPARTYIDKLVDIYFHDFNWMYYALDRDIFDRQMAEWFSLPFNLLTNGGPQSLSPDLRAFPAMLFQVCASALLILPSGPDPTFDPLKYAGNMTFEDLAMDYSESGVAILSLLGKRQMSITTVLAGFLRASFLKYVALVTESWHAIGSAIRDAQEIGLHRYNLDPKPDRDTAEAVLENQWEIQRRRKVWMILVGWDVHTAVVLGRPTTINLNVTPPILPVDCPIPKDRSRTPVYPRNENDPPTPLTRMLWAYKIMTPLRDILDLEKEGPCPKDFHRVSMIHDRLLELQEQTPSFFRLENPDTRFDNLPDCHWIHLVRTTLPQLLSFDRMALHRPYIFTRAKSRTEALKASLDMLDAQRVYFQSLGPRQYKTFTLFFGTFDAIVLMASIYILFPKEQPEHVENAMQHFQWSVERFEAMSERNALARAALGVLQAIRIRLKKSLGLASGQQQAVTAAITGRSPLPALAATALAASVGSTPATEDASPRMSSADGSSALAAGSASSIPIFGGSTGGASVGGPSTGSSMSAMTPSGSDFYSGSGSGSTGGGNAQFDWSNFDWSSIQPIFATQDLVYNDLVGIPDGDGSVPQWGAGGSAGHGLGGGDLGGQPWQFEGDFGNDSVWNLLNQYTPF